MSDRESAIVITGQMMLGGWKLTGMHCERCHSTLVEKNEVLHCPMCNRPVNLVPYTGDASDVNETRVSLEEEKKAWDISQRGMKQISAKLGERMMSGYTLLSELCPSPACGGTPLVSKKVGPKFCVACETSYELDPQQQRLIAIGISPSSSSLSSPLPSTVQAKEERPKNSSSSSAVEEEATRRISQKLLMGWAMLDETCRNSANLCTGSVPLMRDKQGQKHCFECMQITTSNGEIVGSSGNITNDKQSAGSNNLAKMSSPLPSAATGLDSRTAQRNDGDGDDDEDDELEEKKGNEMQSLFANKRIKTTSATTSAVMRSAAGKVTKDKNTNGREHHISDAVTILKEKIYSVATELKDCKDITSCIALAGLLTSLAEAVKALNGIAY